MSSIFKHGNMTSVSKDNNCVINLNPIDVFNKVDNYLINIWKAIFKAKVSTDKC